MRRPSIFGLCWVLMVAANPTAAALYDCRVTGERDQPSCCCPAEARGATQASLPCATEGTVSPRTELSAPSMPCCEMRPDPGTPASPVPAATVTSGTSQRIDGSSAGTGAVPSIAAHLDALVTLAARRGNPAAIGPPGPALQLLSCSFRC